MDGGWSAWSSWEECLQKNDEELKPDDAQDKCLCQIRKCNNPYPRNNGKQCKGTENIICQILQIFII